MCGNVTPYSKKLPNTGPVRLQVIKIRHHMHPENPRVAGTSPPTALLDEARWEERRAAVSWVASIIVHMIGTPLNVIAGRAAMIRAESGAAAATENAARIEAQVEKLAHRLRQFIDYLSLPEPGRQMQPIDALVHEAISIYEPMARERRILLVVRPERLPRTRVERVSSLIGLTGLLSLAIRAAARETTLRLVVDQASERRVALALFVPGLVLPPLGLAQLQPPSSLGDEDPSVAERIRLLHLFSAVVRRQGGRLEVMPDPPAGSVLRMECPTEDV